jgi:PAS domain S-box-containing protein
MVQSLKILLADDEDAVHKTLGYYLTDQGHHLDMVFDGISALNLLEFGDYDIAIVDIRMPGIDGLSLLAKIQELRSDMPVAIITGHGNMEIAIEALRLGAADFIQKPVKLLELDAVIEKCFRIRRLLVQRRENLESLQKARDTLELRVEERTTELLKANGKLQLEIAERLKVEDALRKSETRYRELFETSYDGIAIIDMQGRFMDCNRAYLDLLGYSTTRELSSLTHSELTPSEYHEMESKLIKEQALSWGFCHEYEKEYIHKTGKRIPISQRLWVRYGDNKEPIGMWVIARDITEHKQIEVLMYKSEEMYRSLIENLSYVIYILDPLGYITYISSAIENASGYTPKELIGRHFSQLIYSSDLYNVISNQETVLRGESALYEARMVDRFNQIHQVNISNRPLMGEGQITGIIGIISEMNMQNN